MRGRSARGKLAGARCVLALVSALVSAATTGTPARAELSAEDVELRVSIAERQGEMVELLADWVGRNTGTWNTAGLEAFAALVAEELKKLDFEVTVVPSAPLDYPGRKDARIGPIVVAEHHATAEPEHARHFLLLGHLDTVFEPDSDFQRWAPDPQNPERAVGPGASDMKGGLVVMLYALRALAESGDLAHADVTVLLDSDEELGSLGSRERIEAAAKKAEYGFVFEAARETGELARSRAGAGQFHLDVTGVAAHVGSAPNEGHSAIVALAKKVVAIESLTDYDRGILLNVGTIEGGTKRNVVPDHASAWIDLRYDEAADGEAVRAKLEEIAAAPDVPGTSAKLWGKLHRPPKPETPAVAALLKLQQKVARELGFPAPDPQHSSSVTDGSLAQSVGLATLDALGVRGGEAHTDREFVVLPSLSERAAIAAVLIRRLARAPAEDSGLPATSGRVQSLGPSPPVIAGSRPVVGP
jgi:glutamate carboxypeptidase